MFHIICTFQRGTRVQPCRHKRLIFNPALRVPTRPRPDLHRAFQHSAMADARDHSRTPRRAYWMVTIKGRNPFRIWEDEVAEPKDVGALVDLVKNHKATVRLQNIDAADLRLLLTNDASSQLDPLKPPCRDFRSQVVRHRALYRLRGCPHHITATGNSSISSI